MAAKKKSVPLTGLSPSPVQKTSAFSFIRKPILTAAWATVASTVAAIILYIYFIALAFQNLGTIQQPEIPIGLNIVMSLASLVLSLLIWNGFFALGTKYGVKNLRLAALITLVFLVVQTVAGLISMPLTTSIQESVLEIQNDPLLTESEQLGALWNVYVGSGYGVLLILYLIIALIVGVVAAVLFWTGMWRLGASVPLAKTTSIVFFSSVGTMLISIPLMLIVIGFITFFLAFFGLLATGILMMILLFKEGLKETA